MAEKYPTQMRFELSAVKNSLSIPDNLSRQASTSPIVNFLTHDKLWSGVNGKAVLYELDNEGNPSKQLSFRPKTFEITENQATFPDAVVILMPSFNSDEEIGKIRELIERLNQNGGALFIFEKIQNKNATNQELDQRIAIMEMLGMVSSSVKASQLKKIKGLEKYLLWEGRFRNHTRREKSNLLAQNGDPAHDERVRRRMDRIAIIKRQYAQLGWNAINLSELINLLKNSGDHRISYDALKNGWGVDLQGNCGCHVQISKNGVYSRIKSCVSHKYIPDDQLFDKGIKDSIFVLGLVSYGVCADCTSKTTISNIEVAQHGKNMILRQDTRCPYCGTINGANFSVPFYDVVKR